LLDLDSGLPFPSFPPDRILSYLAVFEKKRQLKNLHEVISKSPRKFPSLNLIPPTEEEQNEVIQRYAPWIRLIARERFSRANVKEAKKILNTVYRTRERLENKGEKIPRKKILNRANKILYPDTQGRPVTYSEEEIVVLKYNHRELQKIIKMIRMDTDLSDLDLKSTKEYIEGISDILTDKEILDILRSKSSPSKVSLEIMSGRLEKTNRRKLTPRSIENILGKIDKDLTPNLDT
jgi:hypothetical protein